MTSGNNHSRISTSLQSPAGTGSNSVPPATAGDAAPAKNNDCHVPPALHRIAAVRKQQGISIRTAARHLAHEVTRVRMQEDETSDLRISELRKWQMLLDVPLADLLIDPGPSLSRPVLERAKMLRIMKTVATIRERATVPGMQRLAEMLFDQLVDLMPELKEVPPWHSVGQRRGLDEYGSVVDRRMPDDLLFRPCKE